MLQKARWEASSQSPPSQSLDLRMLRDELDSLRLKLNAVESIAADSAQHELAQTQLVEEILKSRRRRDSVFGAELFGEPAWDIMLSLFLAEKQQIRVSVSDACRASASPQTTGLRWIKLLEVEGWLERKCDVLDGRRMWLTLTYRARSVMRDYLDQLAVKAA